MSVTHLEPKTRERAVKHFNANDGCLEQERSLVAEAKLGNAEAFGELYQRHHAKTFRTAFRILRNRHDAEDAVQRAFHRALLNLGRFRGDSTFSTWVTRIAINEALMMLRRRRSCESLPGDDRRAAPEEGVEIVGSCPTPEEILCDDERREIVHRAIGQLRENLRVVVLHREFQGLTNVETAKRLGLTVSAVKARAFHARRFLRKHLERSAGRRGNDLAAVFHQGKA